MSPHTTLTHCVILTHISGIPTVRTEDAPPSTSHSKRDAAKDKAEALAKARAIVEEQNKQIAELEKEADAGLEETGGKNLKREREDDGVDDEPEKKKRVKEEAEADEKKVPTPLTGAEIETEEGAGVV